MNDASRRTALLLVFATVCIDLLGFGLVLPLLPIYGRELTVGFSPESKGWILGLLMSCFSVMQFLFAPFWGRFSDRLGRRPVLLVSLAGSTFFYALFGLASQWHSLAWMFVARIGAGIACASIPTAQAYIADVTPAEKRTHGMALIGAAFGLGFTLGPLIGAAALLISRDAGMSPWPGYVASMLSAAALVLAVFKLPESLDRRAMPDRRRHFDFTSLRQTLAIPSMGLLLLVVFIGVFALAEFEGTISLAIDETLRAGEAADSPAAADSTDDETAAEVHWRRSFRLMLVFAYIGLIQSLVQGVAVRRLAHRFSEAALSTAGALLSLAGFTLLALTCTAGYTSLGLLMAATAVLVSGIAMVFPAIQSLISRRADPAAQGGTLGANESVSAMARITGVMIGMRLFYQAPALPFWSAAVLMAAALALVTLAVRAGRDWTPQTATAG